MSRASYVFGKARAAMFEGLMVGGPESLRPVPNDGKTSSVFMLRGNTVMMGYFKNEAATRKALADGWFRTDDVAVMHENGLWCLMEKCMPMQRQPV